MSNNPTLSTPLTLTHLRFDLIALDTIKLDGYRAGHYLRGALGNVLLRFVCPEPKGTKPTPEHAAVCPACWLLSAEVDPGQVRRAYSLCPPLPVPNAVLPGEKFSFGLTLYGEGTKFLPYFVLAMQEVGRSGLGPGRGRFEMESIWAVHPLTHHSEPVLLPGSDVVHVPSYTLDWEELQACLPGWHSALENTTYLLLHFQTPMRLIHRKRLLKSPDFGIFFRHLLKRIDELAKQFSGGERRPAADVQRLHTLADQVRLVASEVNWIDFFGGSERRKNATPLSGFVGRATYQADDWSELLPWLLFGQGTQAGKHVVRGNGVFEVTLRGED